MFYDPYFILVIPAILIAFYAQFRVKSTFNKYSKITNFRGITGADAARRILDSNGLHSVNIERVEGSLTDHYDPRTRTVRLSEDVYNKTSIAAIGVAAHETGHAIQHAKAYGPLAFRNNLLPVANVGSGAAIPLIILGMFLGAMGGIFINLGIILFSFAVLFQIITLPVEFNASKRALATLGGEAYLEDNELSQARKVLNAAALTYVAAALVSVMELIRFVLIARGDD